MTADNYRHLILIIDRSGSMSLIRDGMQSGYQEFIQQQLSDTFRTTASLYHFNHLVEQLSSFASLGNLLDYHLNPSGTTALNDAVISAITTEGAALEALPEDERPARVFVAIVTDGFENASTEYPGETGKARVAQVIKHQQEVYNWGITYLGTNQDAVLEGSKIGIGGSASLNFTNTAAGAAAAWSASSSMLERASSVAMDCNVPMSSAMAYTSEERAQAGSKSIAEPPATSVDKGEGK